jgi:hypothetical protein
VSAYRRDAEPEMRPCSILAANRTGAAFWTKASGRFIESDYALPRTGLHGSPELQ